MPRDGQATRTTRSTRSLRSATTSPSAFNDVALRAIRVTLEEREVRSRRGGIGAHAGEHFGHKPAAGMGRADAAGRLSGMRAQA